MKKIFLLLTVLILSVSCSSDDDSTMDNNNIFPTPPDISGHFSNPSGGDLEVLENNFSVGIIGLNINSSLITEDTEVFLDITVDDQSIGIDILDFDNNSLLGNNLTPLYNGTETRFFQVKYTGQNVGVANLNIKFETSTGLEHSFTQQINVISN